MLESIGHLFTSINPWDLASAVLNMVLVPVASVLGSKVLTKAARLGHILADLDKIYDLLVEAYKDEKLTGEELKEIVSQTAHTIKDIKGA